jgi:hypothetical protein
MWGRWPQAASSVMRGPSRASAARFWGARRIRSSTPQSTVRGWGGRGSPQPAKPPLRAKRPRAAAQPGVCRCREAISSSAGPTSRSGSAKALRQRPRRTEGRARKRTPSPSSRGGRGMGRPVRPAGASSSRRSKWSGWRRASSTATAPPIEAPIRPRRRPEEGSRRSSASSSASRCSRTLRGVYSRSLGRGQKPNPCRSGISSR